MAKSSFIVIAASTFMFLASPSQPGEFVFIAGKGYDVCESYLKNIHSFKNLPYDVVCERPAINPKFKRFKRPEWKQLDVWEKRELVIQFEFRTTTSYRFETEEGKKRVISMIDNSIKNGYKTLHETYIDVNNDGKEDHLYRVDFIPSGTWKCDPVRDAFGGGPGGMYYIVWNDEDNTINELFSYLGGLRWGFFTYKGKTYYDYYSSGVLLVKKSGVSICEFQYVDKTTKGDQGK